MNTVRMVLKSLLILMVGACAHDPGKQNTAESREFQCAAGEKMVCEVRNTGRIQHGSFSKANSRCACLDDRAGAPNIPAVQ